MQVDKDLVQQKIARRSYGADEETRSEEVSSPSSQWKVSHKYHSLLSGKRVASTDDSINEDGMDAPTEEPRVKVYTKSQWLKILKNNDLDNTSVTELVQSLRHGIPEELRPQIWEFLAQTNSLKQKYPSKYYEKLKNTPSSHDSIINKDIGRTFPKDSFFRDANYNAEGLLFNILRAYSNHDSEIGYTQGMNYVVGKLLIILNPENFYSSDLEYFENYEEEFEEKIFWIFLHIAETKNCRQLYKNNFPKMHEMITALSGRIKHKIPEAHTALENHEMDAFNCFHSMFICLLLDSSPTPFAKRLLDLFFIEDEKIIFKVIIRAMLICKKELLIASETEEIYTFIKHEMLQKAYDKHKRNLYLLFPNSESSD